MNRGFGVTDYKGGGVSRRKRVHIRRRGRAVGVSSGLALVAALTLSVIVGLLLPLTAAGNPHHGAGDYVIFAKAGAEGITTDQKAFEPDCDNSNHGQGETSGQTNNYYGRIHSNADLKLAGANTFGDTISPDTEITYGVNDGAADPCQLQNDGGNTFLDGMPLNISGNGDPADIQGPYQIGPGGWPGNLGTFLVQTGTDAFERFDNTTQFSAVGMTCTAGHVNGLLGTTDYIVTAADNGDVVCNGTGKIIININGLGTDAAPFRITMLSHGAIETPGQNNVLAPAAGGHGVLAWTDVAFGTAASGILLNGSNLAVPERSILFAPRSGVDVSGSVDDDVCIQAIGQGIVKVAGSTSNFGPFGPGCGTPASVVTQIHAGNDHNTDIQGGAVEVGTSIHDRVVVASR